MATTGEECFHQKPIRYYFDSNYDLLFDAAVEHYCTRFLMTVIPAQRCGTCCLEFRPLAGPPHAIPSNAADATAAQAHDARVRAFIRRRLHEVCKEIKGNATYLQQQIAVRERRWRQADAWLNRQDTQLYSVVSYRCSSIGAFEHLSPRVSHGQLVRWGMLAVARAEQGQDLFIEPCQAQRECLHASGVTTVRRSEALEVLRCSASRNGLLVV